MRRTSKLLESQFRLTQRTRRSRMDVLSENRKSLPQGISLEGKNNLHIGTFCHTFDKTQVASQSLLLQNINWGVNLTKVDKFTLIS